MSRGMKIVAIILGVLVVIFVALVGGGWYWWAKHGRGMLEAGQSGQSEGQAYGRTTDEQGCLDTAIERYALNKGIAGVYTATMFLGGCLPTSEPTPGFCNDVPPGDDLVAGKSYGEQVCQEAGVTDEYCPAILRIVQKHCEADTSAPDDGAGEDGMMPEDEGNIEEPVAKDA